MLLNVQAVSAAKVVGKVVTSSQNADHPATYPLVAGKTTTYTNDSLLKFSGGTLLVSGESKLSAFEFPENTIFKINKGAVSFRLQPNKRSVIFEVPQGRLVLPNNKQNGNSATSGRITINPDQTTIIEVDQGELFVQTAAGKTTVSSGQAFVLAQSNPYTKSNGSDSPSRSENGTQKKKGVLSEPHSPTAPSHPRRYETNLPPELDDLLDLIGLPGVAETSLSPTGKLKTSGYVEWDGSGELVDYNLEMIPQDSLPKGSTVKVVCVRTSDQKVLVRPIDKLYPEKPLEITLVGNSVIMQEPLVPEGYVMLDKNSNEAWKNGLEKRSWGPWTALLVGDDLRPISELGSEEHSYNGADEEQVDENQADENHEGEKYTIVCMRSTLLVRPLEEVKKGQVALVGKHVIAKTTLNPSGKVVFKRQAAARKADMVDYNLEPIEDIEIPKGTELIVVAVDVESNTLLVQPPDMVLEENKFIGNVVTTATELKPYGNVWLQGDKWIGALVGDDLKPLYPDSATSSEYEAGGGGNSPSTIGPGSELIVVGVVTTLLVQSGTTLLAAFIPPAPIAQAFAIPADVLVGSSLLVGTGVLVGLCAGGVICQSEDPPASPLTP